VEGRNHPPPPLEATRAPRGQQQPAAAVWPIACRGVGAGRGAPWTWSGQRNNAGVPTKTYLAFPTTELSGKRALASGRRLSEFSQVSRRARTFSSKTIAKGSASNEKRRECIGARRGEFKGLGTNRRNVKEARLKIVLRSEY